MKTWFLALGLSIALHSTASASVALFGPASNVDWLRTAAMDAMNAQLSANDTTGGSSALLVPDDSDSLVNRLVPTVTSGARRRGVVLYDRVRDHAERGGVQDQRIAIVPESSSVLVWAALALAAVPFGLRYRTKSPAN